MGFIAFRLTNFRSIVDSGWVGFSPDGVTVLVGQNESGKTSILQALYCALSRKTITPDDKRVGAAEPIVYLRAKIKFEDIDPDELTEFEDADISALKKMIRDVDGIVDLSCRWMSNPNENSLKNVLIELAVPEQINGLLSLIVRKSASPASDGNGENTENHPPPKRMLDDLTTAELIWSTLPTATLFNAETGLLPNTIDIDEHGRVQGTGQVAARNFLTIAEINLQKLIKEDGRYQQNVLNRANQRVSEDFASFWSQIIGTKSKLTLKCEFAHYNVASGDKVGRPYLEFWIADGNTQLYPRQRSQGVRWFVSFYLQLRATEKSGFTSVFLLDEPGANLHDRAQSDVLKLIDRLKAEIPIVYSTHSPKMIEYEKLFRVRAVQRDSEQEDSPTIVMDGHHLGAASSDTLSPILAAMGSDMSQQSVIKKSKNVLLEEISGYYYLKAFWKLCLKTEEVHFIAATGVNKLPLLANMFLGWGLNFIVAVDDDKQGREVYNQLKKELCGDREDIARDRLLKFPECSAIEEAFSKNDFKEFVIRNTDANIPNGNGDYLKTAQISKPITAFEFLLAVQSDQIKRQNLDATTLGRVDAIVEAVISLLSKHS